MPRKVINLHDLVNPDLMAKSIGQKFDEWKMARNTKEHQIKEVRDYIFATDTQTTANSRLPWKNKTTRPKLTQIRDNLESNYTAALFATDDFFTWMPSDETSADKDKAKAIYAYMKNKFRESGAELIVQKLLLDWIDTGCAFGDTEFVREEMKNDRGETVQTYIGPKIIRISYYDHVFDITAADYRSAPKITRHLYSMGDLVKASKNGHPVWSTDEAKSFIKKMREVRREVSSSNPSDIKKSDGLRADGFGSIWQYYGSGMVEVLEFEGDMYDPVNDILVENSRIIVMDRAYIVWNKPFDNWFGRSTKHYVGWRMRPDNLLAMGPLDNLVGMQYRIDHLENLKADVFDLIAYPVFKIKGYVENFEYGPLERIHMDADADVEMVRPEPTALNAEIQIDQLEMQMEEMAGAPKTAVGIRTPGEKTKFEVQVLDNAASRVFLNKLQYFERNFLEPLLNDMLEVARRNMDAAELVRVVDDDLGIVKFLQVTRKDLEAKGRLVPMGSRYFQAQAQLIQNLTNLSGTGIYQDPAVNVHFSGLRIAELIQDNLGLAQHKVVEPNIRLIENAESQRIAQTANDQVAAEAQTPAMTEEDIPEGDPETGEPLEEEDDSGFSEF